MRCCDYTLARLAVVDQRWKRRELQCQLSMENTNLLRYYEVYETLMIKSDEDIYRSLTL